MAAVAPEPERVRGSKPSGSRKDEVDLSSPQRCQTMGSRTGLFRQQSSMSNAKVSPSVRRLMSGPQSSSFRGMRKPSTTAIQMVCRLDSMQVCKCPSKRSLLGSTHALKSTLPLFRPPAPPTQSFPMYVMSVADFLELEQLEPHQVLRDRGKLLIYEENEHVAEGPIFFFSHQWTSFTAPNPTLEQLKCIQNMLRSMLAGSCRSTSPDMFDQAYFEHDVSVSSREWKKLAACAHVWLDYTSVPQIGVYHNADADEEANQLIRAVNSIPAYIEHTTVGRVHEQTPGPARSCYLHSSHPTICCTIPLYSTSLRYARLSNTWICLELFAT